MVERLKAAIEKAREQRGALEGAAAPVIAHPADARPPRGGDQTYWDQIPEFTPDDIWLHQRRIVTRGKSDPAHVAFDVLRTRLLKVCGDNGWTRIGITSPTKGCGKSVVCANLAFSLARHSGRRTILADLDLKIPSLARYLGLRERLDIASCLAGEIPPKDFLRRVGDNLALCLNTERVANSAETIQNSRTNETLAAMIRQLAPTLVIYDLPPMLVSDDTIAFLGNVDGVLLVAAAGQTRASDISECERLLDGNTNFLGVLLNKCQNDPNEGYQQIYQSGYA